MRLKQAKREIPQHTQISPLMNWIPFMLSGSSRRRKICYLPSNSNTVIRYHYILQKAVFKYMVYIYIYIYIYGQLV